MTLFLQARRNLSGIVVICPTYFLQIRYSILLSLGRLSQPYTYAGQQCMKISNIAQSMCKNLTNLVIDLAKLIENVHTPFTVVKCILHFLFPS